MTTTATARHNSSRSRFGAHRATPVAAAVEVVEAANCQGQEEDPDLDREIQVVGRADRAEVAHLDPGRVDPVARDQPDRDQGKGREAAGRDPAGRPERPSLRPPKSVSPPSATRPASQMLAAPTWTMSTATGSGLLKAAAWLTGRDQADLGRGSQAPTRARASAGRPRRVRTSADNPGGDQPRMRRLVRRTPSRLPVA